MSTDSDTDSDDISLDDNPSEYREETWGKNIDGEYVIDGYKFKGRQPFRKAKEELEQMITRNSHYKIGNFIIKVLDARNKGIEMEADIEIKATEKENKGIAVLKLYGPNKRKENTVTITKYKQSDIQFVTLMAEKVIKPLLKMILEERNFSRDTIRAEKALSNIKCKICEKTFKTRPGLKSHMTKKHREDQEIQSTADALKVDTEVMTEHECKENGNNSNERVNKKENERFTFNCNKCESDFSRKYELIQHSLKHKQKCSSIKLQQNKISKHCTFCNFVANDANNLKRHKRDTHDVLSASTSPPPKKAKVTRNTSTNEEEDMDIDTKETVENM